MRTCIKKVRLCLGSHFITQAQGTLYSHSGISKISVVEDSAGFIVIHPAVPPDNFRYLRPSHVSSFVSEASLVLLAATSCPDIADVEKLNLAFATLILAIGHNPDVRPDAGVVEHLLRQSDDSLKPVVFDDPLSDLAF